MSEPLTSWSRPRVAVRACLAVTALLLAAACSSGNPAVEPSVKESLDLSPSASTGSTWTPEQQEVVDGLVAFNDVLASFLQGDELDMAKMRAVAAEPYATASAEQISTTTEAGFVMTGKDRYTTESVRISGEKATLSACWDSSTSTVVNGFQKPPATVQPLPPAIVSFTLQRSKGAWLVASRESGRAC